MSDINFNIFGKFNASTKNNRIIHTMHCPKNNKETKILIFFKTFRYVLNSNNGIYIGLNFPIELPIHNSLKKIYLKAFID